MTSLALPVPSLPSDPPEQDTLLLMAPGKRALRLIAEGQYHTPLHALLSRSQVLHALETGAGDSLILAAAPNRRPQASLIRLLRRHADLSALPIMVLEPKPTHRHTLYWTAQGADFVIADENLPVGLNLLRQAAQSRSAARRIVGLLRATRLGRGGAISPLVAPRYFDAALAQRLADGNRFSLAALRLDPVDGGDPAAALSEASVYLAMASRAMDMICRPSPDQFLIALPGADRRHGEAVINAMTTMIADLKFGPQDDPCTFTARAGIVEGTDTKSVEALIGAAIKAMPAHPVAALLPA